MEKAPFLRQSYAISLPGIPLSWILRKGKWHMFRHIGRLKDPVSPKLIMWDDKTESRCDQTCHRFLKDFHIYSENITTVILVTWRKFLCCAVAGRWIVTVERNPVSLMSVLFSAMISSSTKIYISQETLFGEKPSPCRCAVSVGSITKWIIPFESFFLLWYFKYIFKTFTEFQLNKLKKCCYSVLFSYALTKM